MFLVRITLELTMVTPSSSGERGTETVSKREKLQQQTSRGLTKGASRVENSHSVDTEEHRSAVAV